MPAGERVREYTWVLELQASPEALWPYVSNTERLNRAAGLSAVSFSAQAAAGSGGEGLLPAVERYGTFKKAGITSTWREHPFEWIEGRRLGVLREFSSGVFKWLASTTTLESKTNFFAAGRSGVVRAEATPLHRGKRTQVWQTRVTDESGRLLSLTTQTQMVLM